MRTLSMEEICTNTLRIEEFNRLYNLHNRTLLNMARKYSSEHYKDIVQEVWLKVFKGWNRYRATCSDPELVMLKQITKTKSIDYLRIWKHREWDPPFDVIYELEVDRTIDIESLNLKKVLKQVINEIPDIKLRHIAINKFLKDMELNEIADDLYILGHKISKQSISKYVWSLQKFIIKRIRNWKVSTMSDLKFELDIPLGDTI